jgi:hypothetical protein
MTPRPFSAGGAMRYLAAIGSRLCNVIAKGTASTCAYPRDGADQSRSVSKTGQYDAHLFGDLWRQGGDLTGPGMIARSARAGHDGQTFDHEPTAHVLALRADDWERLTGVWQGAAFLFLRVASATFFRLSDAFSSTSAQPIPTRVPFRLSISTEPLSTCKFSGRR